MTNHPAFAANRAAVITGAASGIGLAAATRFAGLGMKLMLADANASALSAAADRLAILTGRPEDVHFLVVDVSNAGDIARLRDATYAAFGEVAVLMNNAAIGGGSGVLGDRAKWQDIIGVNLWGVINGVQEFAPAMIRQAEPSAIVNTGSKQGITTPPGDAAYNVSKAGVKVVTEALAHELRNIEGCRVSAHLLIPGFTFTGLTAAAWATKPAAAWTPEQVVECLLASMATGDFYILCPDNEVTRDMDERRILWAAEDIIENRPALSRWHPEYKAAFVEFMKAGSVRRQD
jgi:NAD(P)-dependent dehydrogenase (short-subunit alcohol dehydrogenase family)